jgi:hypothetical protein
LEKSANASFTAVAATVIAFGVLAGELKQASHLLFPAETA